MASPPEELRRCAGGSGRPVRGSEQGRAGADLHFGQVERCHESQRLRSWRHVTSLRSWRHVTSWGRALPPPQLGGALFFASPLGAPGDWPSSLGSTLIMDPRPTQPGSCWETLALGASPPGVTVGAEGLGMHRWHLRVEIDSRPPRGLASPAQMVAALAFSREGEQLHHADLSLFPKLARESLCHSGFFFFFFF